MGLVDLPTELIRQIIQRCQPDSFERLLLTSKDVFAAGQCFIKEHNWYKSTFSNVEIRGEWGDNADICRGLVRLLGIIATDPRAELYIQNFTVVDERWDMVRKENMGLYLGSNKRMNALEPATWALLADIVSNSPWLKVAGCDSAAWIALLADVQDIDDRKEHGEEGGETIWRDEVRREVLLALLILLLTRLTHLRTINIKYDVQFSSRRHDNETSSIVHQATAVLNLMSASASRGGNEFPPAQPLRDIGRPTTSPLEGLVSLNYCPPSSLYNAMDASALNPFITLPHLHQLRATNLRTAFDLGYTYDWPTQTGMLDVEVHSSFLAVSEHSTIATLELAHCCVDPPGIASLLQRMPHLTTLRYTHQAKAGETENDYTAGWDFDAGQFLKAIAYPNQYTDTNEAVKLSSTPAMHIAELSIGFEHCYGRVITGVSGKSLQQFSNLKKLSLDVLVFMGMKPNVDDDKEDESAPVDSDDGRSSNSVPDLDDEEWEPEMPRLIDFLPSTLEALELFVQRQNMQLWCLDSWTELLDGFRGKRQEQLPNLTTFVVRENSLMRKGLGTNGLYEEVEVHDDPASVQYRNAALEAGAEFISANGTMMSWRQELEEKAALVHSSGHYAA